MTVLHDEHDAAKRKAQFPVQRRGLKYFHASWDFYLFIAEKATLFLTSTKNRGYKPSHEKPYEKLDTSIIHSGRGKRIRS